MPCFILFTNVATSDLPKRFLFETSKIIAKAIRKPESLNVVEVRIHPGQMMTHGGTTEPCANSELQAIGHISAEENIQMSKEISEFLQQKLGIDPSRNYIKFTDMKPYELGCEGTTIEVLWSKQT
ncbi:macrophage migration inhibitory factor-like [Haliotis rubra]|uniref:macrophage migration inhibitory factor-like n=1 Tax=Haliotis rubra TaxID=36100 RepID=UPI001EE5592E|nr:macrophage migration inhibitory factor-like [Haliotis rubra]